MRLYRVYREVPFVRLATLLLAPMACWSASCGGEGVPALSVAPPDSTPVGPVVVASVNVTLPNSRLAPGDTVRAVASPLSLAGTVVPGKRALWMTTNPAVATVDSTGLLLAVAPGTAEVIATVDGLSGSASFAVDGTTASAGAPELPREFLNFAFPTVTGRTIRVAAGANLQAALDNARRGDEVVLEAGATFRGVFTLPAKPGTAADGWVTVRSSRLPELPAGTRVTPGVKDRMPRIESPDAQAALSTALTADGWWIAGIEISVNPAFTAQQNGIVRLGDGSTLQNAANKIATNLVLDRVYLHGESLTNTKRCLALNSARTVIQDSWLGNCHGTGFDAQAIAGWNGPGPYRIVNNTLEGSGENVMFGGSDPAVPQLTPVDIEIRRNHVVTPIAWKGTWMKKNLFELKHARRVLVEGNVFEGSWADGQVGYAFVLKSVNQAGGCGWCATTDVTVRRNVIRNVGAGFNLAGAPESFPVQEPLGRILIEQNVVEGVLEGPYSGDGRILQVLAGARDLVVRQNTMTGAAGLNGFLILGDKPAHNLAWERNIVSHGLYGIKAAGRASGSASLSIVTGAVTFTNSVIIGGATGGYPAGTRFVSSLAAALAVQGVGADDALVRQATAGVVVP